MTTGTITLTTNSDAVTGSGTSFTTELTNGDFIVADVGGISYTLAIKTVNSNTSLTLVNKYTGPTMPGLGFEVVTKNAMSMVTAAIVVQNTEALRGLNYDKQNWQQLFTATGIITVKLPDGSTWTGPAWNRFTAELNNKAEKGVNNDITELKGVTVPLSISQGGTGSKTPFGDTANTFCQGNDSRLNTINGKSGGTISSNVSVSGRLGTKSGNGVVVNPGNQSGGSGTNPVGINNSISAGESGAGGLVSWTYYGWYTEQVLTGIRRAGDATIQSYIIQLPSGGNFTFFRSGSATAPGTWTNGSDERHKTNIKLVDNALASVLSWRGCTYDRKDAGTEVGLIAQDVEKSCPYAVINTGVREFKDGSVINDFKALNTAGAAAAFHTEAIKSLVEIIELSIDDPDSAKQRLTEIKKSVVEISAREINNSSAYTCVSESQEDKT